MIGLAQYLGILVMMAGGIALTTFFLWAAFSYYFSVRMKGVTIREYLRDYRCGKEIREKQEREEKGLL